MCPRVSGPSICAFTQRRSLWRRWSSSPASAPPSYHFSLSLFLDQMLCGPQSPPQASEAAGSWSPVTRKFNAPDRARMYILGLGGPWLVPPVRPLGMVGHGSNMKSGRGIFSHLVINTSLLSVHGTFAISVLNTSLLFSRLGTFSISVLNKLLLIIGV